MAEIDPNILRLARKRRAALAAEAERLTQWWADRARTDAEAQHESQKDKDQRREGLTRLVEDARQIGALALQKGVTPNLHIVEGEVIDIRTWWGGEKTKDTRKTVLTGWGLYDKYVSSKPRPVTKPDPDADPDAQNWSPRTITTLEPSGLKRIVLYDPTNGLYVADCESVTSPRPREKGVAHVSDISTLAENPTPFAFDDDTFLPTHEELETAKHRLAAIIEPIIDLD